MPRILNPGLFAASQALIGGRNATRMHCRVDRVNKSAPCTSLFADLSGSPHTSTVKLKFLIWIRKLTSTHRVWPPILSRFRRLNVAERTSGTFFVGLKSPRRFVQTQPGDRCPARSSSLIRIECSRGAECCPHAPLSNARRWQGWMSMWYV